MDRAALLAGVAVIGAAAYWYMNSGGGSESDQSPDLIDYGNQITESGSDADEMTAQNNIAAFLVALRGGEGTSGSDGYTKLVGGGNFSSYATHPALNGWGGWQMPQAMAAAAGYPGGAVSTAAGAFQINKPTWLRVAAKCGLSDFSPASQDAAAIQLISEKGALDDVRAGRVDVAAGKVRKIWASLPGAGYGQNEVTMNSFTTRYNNAGGATA